MVDFPVFQFHDKIHMLLKNIADTVLHILLYTITVWQASGRVNEKKNKKWKF